MQYIIFQKGVDNFEIEHMLRFGGAVPPKGILYEWYKTNTQ